MHLEVAKKKKDQEYSHLWDKVSKNLLDHIHTNIKQKIKPSIYQIKQRIRIYEANVEKPKSVLMLEEGSKENSK